MTNKQKVLRRFPKAKLDRDTWSTSAGPSGCVDFGIYESKDSNRLLGYGDFPAKAWAHAALRLR